MLDILNFLSSQPKNGIVFLFLCCVIISFCMAALVGGVLYPAYKLEETGESLIMLVVNVLILGIFIVLTVFCLLSLSGAYPA